MAKNKNLVRFWMPSIMIASLLLLMLFVGYWLHSQYTQTKNRVEVSVRSDLKRTSDQLVDTLMQRLMRKPLEDANIQWSSGTTISRTTDKGERITEYKKVDSIRNGTMINIVVQTDSNIGGKHTFHEIRGKKGENGILKVKTIDNHQGKVVMITKKKTIQPDEQDIDGLFTKGLGVFVKELANIKNDGNVSAITDQHLDSALFKRVLRANWQQAQLVYQPLLGVKKSAQVNSVIYGTTPVFNQQIGVEIGNLDAYLLREIVPQICFAVFIVLITFSGFLFIHRSWKKQLQLNQLRLDFMNNMSHELKTPVSTVKVAIEALQLFNRKNEPAVVDDYLTIINHEMNRLDTLVNKVLSQAMIHNNQINLNKEKVDFVQLTQDVLKRMALNLKDSEITHAFRTDSTEFFTQLDVFHFEGVITNIFDNAIKYAGKHAHLTIDMRTTNHQLQLIIADNGPGVPTENLDQLFHPFFRVTKGNEHAIKGYGLGLSYCHQIIQLHGGTIAVQNNEPQGAKFIIQLPC